MRIKLSGYFDSNFGDDYMIKIIINAMPEYQFVLEEKNEHTSFLLEEPNVSLVDKTDSKLPVLLITGCGFMINTSKALLYEIRWFLQKKKIADYCVGCNIEPLSNKLKEFLISKKLSKFKLIICRDTKSRMWLEAHTKTKIIQLPDIVFGMPNEWIEHQKTVKADKLGISVFHRKDDTENCLYYKKMAQLADYWVEQTGKHVILFAFDSGEENDAFSCKSIQKLMKHPECSKIIEHDSKGSILKAFAECKKVVGARYHSAVLAIRMGIDFYPLTYRDKMKNLIKELNYPVYGSEIDSIEHKHIQDFLLEEKVNYILPEHIITEAVRYSELLKEALNNKV